MESQKPEYSEKEVVNLWLNQVQRQRFWKDTEGNSLEVLYPGRLNDKRGGDFQDACVRTSRGEKQGNIEVHTLGSRWYTHGHHLDPAYNQVILQVVMQTASNTPALLQNGEVIPTLALKERVRRKKSGWSLSCEGNDIFRSTEFIESFLAAAGNVRFESAAAGFERVRNPEEAGQSVYRGIMEALGYSKNKDPFKVVSEQLPLKKLEQIVRDSRDREETLDRIQSRLFGKSGLLPSQTSKATTPEDYQKRIEAEWSACGEFASLKKDDWELFKIRPVNHPVLRLAALSQLLYDWSEKGLLKTLLDLVREVSVERAHIQLESALLVPASGYWAQHFDFGCPRKHPNEFILGKARAAEIIINVLLPFCVSWGRTNFEPLLSRKARAIYQVYPSRGLNSIERHMLNQLNLDRKKIKFFFQQQGLIHIYKNLCTQGKCRECRLSGSPGFQEPEKL